jgi:phage tail-like protein
MVESKTESDRVSSYLEYLPALQQSDKFLGRFLLAMECILSGLTASDTDDRITEQPGLEEYVDRSHTYFNPGLSQKEAGAAPADFLPWLASWVSLSLLEEWPEDFKRQFLANIVPLYRMRGTKAGVKKLLEIYTGEAVKISEFFEEPAHYFQVEITLMEPDLQKLKRKQQIAKAILDQQKPAHTFYSLQVLVPTMQIRNNDPRNGLIVGVTTILGTTSKR